jgi:8-oxo-dGTP diphosphatase
MASRDGNGWVRCALGHRHWGRYGAAGLLAYAEDPADPGDPGDPADAGLTGLAGGTGGLSVLMQRRGAWSHHGGTWGLPGGAADSHESPIATALREAHEECMVPPDAVVIRGIFTDDHGGWAYRTVFGSAPAPFPVFPDSDETDEATWVPAAEVGALKLHPGLAAHWAELRAGLAPVRVIVDAANVMGSRPDGWWRDRAGAARRLVIDVTELAAAGVPEFPASLGLPAPACWYPEFVVVLEGQARGAIPADSGGAAASRSGAAGSVGEAVADGAGVAGAGVRVVSAPGSGDDSIAELAAELGGIRLVVTADRELRARCEAAGAEVTGPRWLTGQLGG